MKRYILPIAMFLGFTFTLWAQSPEPSEIELAKTVQNPLSAIISLPFQNNIDFGVGPYDRTRNTLNIQPVVPIALGQMTLINRIILPVVYGPDPTASKGGAFGLGDLSYSAFLAPPPTGRFVLGFGGSIVFPTRTDPLLGPGEWQAGPSVIIVYTGARLVFGGLLSNYWSLGNDSLNYLSGQYFINYNFDHFYLLMAPLFSVNWKASSSNMLTLPIGLGIGKVFKTKIPLNVNLSYYYNVVRPDNAAVQTIRIQAQLIFPGFGGGK